MSIEILLDIPNSFYLETKYIVENLFFPLNEKVDFVKNYEEFKSSEKIVYCYEDSHFLSNAVEDNKTMYVVLEKSTIDYFTNFQPYNIHNILYIDKIPCLFPLRKSYNFSSEINIFKFDIFAASFFFLSCWQEYTLKEGDGHGRFPLKSTIQHKLGIIRVPIVNEYLKLFEQFVKRLWYVEYEYKKLPGHNHLYVALSHDIDHIDWPLSKYVNTLRNNLKNIDISFTGLPSIFKNCFYKKDVFKKIKDIEMKYGVSSTIYFLPDYPDRHKSFAYNLIKLFDGTAFEVGHHISKEIFSETGLREDRIIFESLVKKIHGARVHILRFKIDKLYLQLEECSYYYDNSLLFPEDMGYRTGFSYPHYLFDPFRRRVFKVLSIPLNIMDNTLVDRKYFGLDDSRAENELFSFIDKAVSYGGVLSILFHHNYFWFNTVRRLRIYDKLLKYLTESNIKVGPCRDIYFWYQENISKPMVT